MTLATQSAGVIITADITINWPLFHFRLLSTLPRQRAGEDR